MNYDEYRAVLTEAYLLHDLLGDKYARLYSKQPCECKHLFSAIPSDEFRTDPPKSYSTPKTYSTNITLLSDLYGEDWRVNALQLFKYWLYGEIHFTYRKDCVSKKSLAKFSSTPMDFSLFAKHIFIKWDK